MRVTLTLDDDLAAKLEAESRHAGVSFQEIVNDTLRYGLTQCRLAAPSQAFEITARDLGDLRPGLSLENVSELIERVEGPDQFVPPLDGVPGRDLLRFAGILDAESAREMEEAIEEDCERVDLDEQ